MNTEHSPALEFPAMLCGSIATTRRKVSAEGRWWARQYLETGVFPQPRQMRQVSPGEVLVMHQVADFDTGDPRWRMHMFVEVFMEELMDDIYRRTLEAWCPQGPAPVREHLALMVERTSCATREDCLEAVLRVIPGLVEVDTALKNREVLSDPDFLRERLSSLAPKKFEDISSAYKYAVSRQLWDWDRELERR
jgi:hypothetical protein